MGAWSHEPFGNDSANDWGYGLVESTGLGYVEASLDRVLEVGEDYLDASDAEEAVAAIEVLAKLLGKGTQVDSCTRKIDAWVKATGSMPSPALRLKAKQALQKVMSENSELCELWEESDEGAQWKAAMIALRAAIDA
jgi:hypothetical protein